MSAAGDVLVDAGALQEMGNIAADALVLAGRSLTASDHAARIAVLERSGDLAIRHRRLSRSADGQLGVGPATREVRAFVDTLSVSALLDQIGQAATRIVADCSNAAALPISVDVNVVDCLKEMADEAARMVSEAVAGFLRPRSSCAHELQVAACRVRSEHRRIFLAAAQFGLVRQREWALWMDEIAKSWNA